MRVVLITLAGALLCIATPAISEPPGLSNEQLVDIAGKFAQDNFYKVDLDTLKATLIFEAGIVYVIFQPRNPIAVGGGPVVALNSLTGEVLGSEMTQ